MLNSTHLKVYRNKLGQRHPRHKRDDQRRFYLGKALEFRLLTTFYDRRGRVQTRERLLTDVWGYQAEVTTRTVDTHMKRLREKLKAAGTYIETVRGVGYRMQARPNQSKE